MSLAGSIPLPESNTAIRRPEGLKPVFQPESVLGPSPSGECETWGLERHETIDECVGFSPLLTQLEDMFWVPFPSFFLFDELLKVRMGLRPLSEPDRDLAPRFFHE